MKLLIFSFLFLLFTCTSKKEEKSAFERSVPKKEKECLKKINEAKKDISEGNIYFCDNSEWLSIGYRSHEERIELLKKYNIIHSFVGSTDIIGDMDDGINCYGKFMREKIDEKYGSHFIDSIFNVADELWFSKHINDTINYYYCDSKALYPGDTEDRSDDEYSKTLSQELRNKLIYPEGYVKNASVDYPNYVNISFDVDKYGNAKIRRYDFNFNSESKKQYEKYFENQLGKYIKKTEWTPAQIRGQNVNSDRTIRFYFE